MKANFYFIMQHNGVVVDEFDFGEGFAVTQGEYPASSDKEVFELTLDLFHQAVETSLWREFRKESE
jgi:hypothetical protein